jgi:hypothetical protein
MAPENPDDRSRHMSPDPDAWLRERLTRAPASLRLRIQRAWAERAEGADGAEGAGAGMAGALAGRLRVVAERLMAEAKAGPPTRETAVTLLAADALITLACEWTAAFDPAALGDAR